MRQTVERIKSGLRCLGLSLMTIAGASLIVTDLAQAQERRTNIIDMLFGRQNREPEYRPIPEDDGPKRKAPRASKKPAQQKARPANRAATADGTAAPALLSDAPPVIVEKKPDAKNVLIVGDFMAGGLSEGLDSAFSQNPGIRITNRSNGSSGFVRDDHFDWPASIAEIIEAEKPAVVIMMIGSNDRQQIKVDGQRESPKSDAWNKEYLNRINLFTAAVKKAGVPLVWVGQPAFKFSTMSTDLLAFNEIYRNATEAAGGTFVDIWDGFVDEKGAFITSGFDINGQVVRLRANDGIRLSSAGKRKVAFYVEKPLQQLLGVSTSPEVAVIKPGTTPPSMLDPLGALIKVDRIAPISFNDPEIDGGTDLLGGTPKGPSTTKLPQEQLTIEGKSPAAQPGRINDFSWPKKPQAAAGVPDKQVQTGSTR